MWGGEGLLRLSAAAGKRPPPALPSRTPSAAPGGEAERKEVKHGSLSPRGGQRGAARGEPWQGERQTPGDSLLAVGQESGAQPWRGMAGDTADRPGQAPSPPPNGEPPSKEVHGVPENPTGTTATCRKRSPGRHSHDLARHLRPPTPGLAHGRDPGAVVTDRHEKSSVTREPGVRVRVRPSDGSKALAVEIRPAAATGSVRTAQQHGRRPGEAGTRVPQGRPRQGPKRVRPSEGGKSHRKGPAAVRVHLKRGPPRSGRSTPGPGLGWEGQGVRPEERCRATGSPADDREETPFTCRAEGPSQPA
ncbi:translation initiation factor IF-2-like [Lutra lutra]|uniref:translation initiation factor IF-2-like n=1 Tax=Lutra lutra TaxID=9657 RepID=UPI001FD09559|nr:translation initiation factor IF-2-like [Lutra lutra]